MSWRNNGRYITGAKYTRYSAEEEEEQQHQQHQQQLQLDDTQRRLQLQALDNEIEYNEVLISEREEEIQGIEQGITELNEIFRDLGMLVNEQESGIRKLLSKSVHLVHGYSHLLI